MQSDSGRIPSDEPLAYFLTWSTYGSWLRGDDRGWVEKPGHFRDGDHGQQRFDEYRLTEPPLTLDVAQRRIVEATIAEHCRIRRWQLVAVNARTQHVHVVVAAAGSSPDDVMNQLKAWCTRKLKEYEQSQQPANARIRHNWWTQRGSKRWLNTSKSLSEAAEYVIEGQGDPTPKE